MAIDLGRGSRCRRSGTARRSAGRRRTNPPAGDAGRARGRSSGRVVTIRPARTPAAQQRRTGRPRCVPLVVGRPRGPRRNGSDPVPEQHLGAVHVADPGQHVLGHQQRADRHLRPGDPGPGPIRVGVGAQRVGAEPGQDDVARSSGVISSQAVGPRRSAHAVSFCSRSRSAPRGLRGRRGCDRELAVQAEMDVHQPVRRPHARGRSGTGACRARRCGSAWRRRAGRRRRRTGPAGCDAGDRATAEGAQQIAGQAVDGVAFGHAGLPVSRVGERCRRRSVMSCRRCMRGCRVGSTPSAQQPDLDLVAGVQVGDVLGDDDHAVGAGQPGQQMRPGSAPGRDGAGDGVQVSAAELPLSGR